MLPFFSLSTFSYVSKKMCANKIYKTDTVYFLPFKCIETHLLLIKSQISTAFQLYLTEIYSKTLLPQVTLWLWFSEIHNKRKIFKSRFQNAVGPHSMFLITLEEILFFCSFVSFLIFSLIAFVNNLDSSSYLTIFNVYSISSFQIIDAVVCKAKSKGRPDP